MHQVTQIDGFDGRSPSNGSISVSGELNCTTVAPSPSFQSAGDMLSPGDTIQEMLDLQAITHQRVGDQAPMAPPPDLSAHMIASASPPRARFSSAARAVRKSLVAMYSA